MKTTRSTASSAAINIRSRHAFAIGRACSIFLGLALALPATATPFRVFNLVTDDQTVNAAQDVALLGFVQRRRHLDAVPGRSAKQRDDQGGPGGINPWRR
jgi:hypothetical protein